MLLRVAQILRYENLSEQERADLDAETKNMLDLAAQMKDKEDNGKEMMKELMIKALQDVGVDQTTIRRAVDATKTIVDAS